MQHPAKFDQQLHRMHLAKKRLLKEYKRQREKSKRESDRSSIHSKFGKFSIILERISGTKFSSKNIVKRQNSLTLNAPDDFTLSSNTEETLKVLSDFARKILTQDFKKRPIYIHINMDKVKKYDLSTNLILAIIVDELNMLEKVFNKRFKWSGTYPRNSSLKRLVKSLGVIKFADIKHQAPNFKESSKINAYHVRCKNYISEIRPYKPNKPSSTAEKFTDHLNGCLSRINRELTREARRAVSTYVAEVIDNIESHSGMKDWSIQGYLDTNGSDWICEISILNFGASIAKTMSDIDPAGYTQETLKPYLNTHLPSADYTKDCLLTVMALQESVSSKNFKRGDTRGKGMMDLIEFFEKINQESNGHKKTGQQAEMQLISGSALINFDKKYTRFRGADGKVIISFNSINDLRARPDKNYVKSLTDTFFPGTIISIKFPLSKNQVETDLPKGEYHVNQKF